MKIVQSCLLGCTAV